MERFCPVCSRMYGTDVTHCEVDGERLVILKEEPSLVGHVLDGKYTLISKLGEGGMGSVYLADQSSMGREVAIKVLRREFSQNRLAIKRFLREARAASKLAHPNTITVYDFGQSNDGLLYLVMERLTGRSLADILDDGGRMPVGRAVHILGQVCDSLSEAHAHGITHRDLKPENIFIEQKVGNTDFVKVLDFGIAKMQGDDSTQATAAGMICGTPSYMSPEQAMGRDIDGRSDIYALGVLLFEMLTDEKPFEGDTPMEVMLKHINEATPNIHDRTGMSVPMGLQRAIERMLSKSATDRPAHCQEVKRLIVEGADTPLVGATTLTGVEAGLDPAIVHPAQITHTALEPRSGERRADRGSSPEKTGLAPAVASATFPPSAPQHRSHAVTYALVAVALFAVLGLIVWQLGDGVGGAPDRPPARLNQASELATPASRPTTAPSLGAGATTTPPDKPPATGPGTDAAVTKADVPPVPEAVVAGRFAGSGIAVAGEIGFGLQALARVPAPAATVTITIASDPSGAKVHGAGYEVLGETPFSQTFVKGSGDLVFSLRKAGYVTKTITVGTSGDIAQHVELVKARRVGNGGHGNPTLGPDGKPSGFGTF